VHTQHPYWALAVISTALLTVCGSAFLILCCLQKWQDFRTSLVDRKLAQLELDNRTHARDEARR
jgi:hypothetical protein